MKNLIKVVKTSRPLIWLVHFSVFVTGSANGPNFSFQNYKFWLGLIIFSLPYSLYIYAVNDYFDLVSDNHNERKGGMYGEKHDKDFARNLLGLGFTGLVIALILSLFLQNVVVILMMLVLSIFPYLYSAPPVRFKSRPFLDFFIGGSLYAAFIFLIGYITFGGNIQNLPRGIIIVSAVVLTFHIAGAIVDVKADKLQNIVTTPIAIGAVRSILVSIIILSLAFPLIYGNNIFEVTIIALILLNILFLSRSVRENRYLQDLFSKYSILIAITVSFIATIIDKGSLR